MRTETFRNLLFVAASMTFAIVPLAICGSKSGKLDWLPKPLAFECNCAALFVSRVHVWSQCVYQVKCKSSDSWIEVPREIVSPMPVAGYRQRVDRIITEVNRRKSINQEIYRGIAVDVARKYAETFPNQPPVVEVKLLNTREPTSDPIMTHPSGRWRLPPAISLDKRRVETLAVFRLIDGKWRDVYAEKRLARTKPESPPQSTTISPRPNTPSLLLPRSPAGHGQLSVPPAAKPLPSVKPLPGPAGASPGDAKRAPSVAPIRPVGPAVP